jgi:hypothetical protein
MKTCTHLCEYLAEHLLERKMSQIKVVCPVHLSRKSYGFRDNRTKTRACAAVVALCTHSVTFHKCKQTFSWLLITSLCSRCVYTDEKVHDTRAKFTSCTFIHLLSHIIPCFSALNEKQSWRDLCEIFQEPEYKCREDFFLWLHHES